MAIKVFVKVLGPESEKGKKRVMHRGFVSLPDDRIGKEGGVQSRLLLGKIRDLYSKSVGVPAKDVKLRVIQNVVTYQDF